MMWIWFLAGVFDFSHFYHVHSSPLDTGAVLEGKTITVPG
jgi:hypothetical protein